MKIMLIVFVGLAVYMLTGLFFALRQRHGQTCRGSSAPGQAVPAEIYDADYYLRAYAGDPQKYIADLRTLPNSLKKCFDLAQPVAGERVLDIGCGRGALSCYCAERGLRVTAVDYSSDAVQLALKAREALPEASRGLLRVERMDVKDLPEDQKFDVIFMADLVEHLYDRQLQELFARIRKILAPGTGRLVIHTAPNTVFINVIFPLKRIVDWPSVLAKRKDFFYARDKYSYNLDMHVNEQTPRSLARHLAGFRSRVWCDDGSSNVISLLTRHFAGADIWAVARLP